MSLIRGQYKTQVIVLFITSCIFLGCAKTVEPKNFSKKYLKSDSLFYADLEYDAYGRPVFRKPLLFRPTESDVLYYIVQYKNSLVRAYFLIKTFEVEGEYAEAMKIIYSDTSSGFKGGLAFTQSALSSNHGGRSTEAELVFLSIALSAPLVGTIGGFLYGAVHSSSVLVKEMNKTLFVDYKEELVLYTQLDYDKPKRLLHLHEYDNFNKNVQKRRYEYDVSSSNPCRVRFKSSDKETLLLEEESCLEIKPVAF